MSVSGAFTSVGSDPDVPFCFRSLDMSEESFGVVYMSGWMQVAGTRQPPMSSLHFQAPFGKGQTEVRHPHS
jgi:hypothetical protein